ncbi:unnamed protein product [Spirodela intermedia]|uniref:Uncharacterized protein n=2 Tax=Spirodela intermedia TaxID=51605 RepID=A0ABN7EBS8_SPIIN|nr:unnamed protein product [Spirodela intermedia]CAA6656516.1 unnamed protein product [Spirodela intermedia]CAA6675365.1 unnamed protein product [Spirodela intermedia]CAA7392104.1 unnamed protein product [Spirodela intermedia]
MRSHHIILLSHYISTKTQTNFQINTSPDRR